MTALALVASLYVIAARLLNKDVAGPIKRTNDSLAKITSGDLNETVSENDSREFASLSAGVNSTVDALKGLIDEAEQRNEQDMDAAKQVGGDFYDFFLVDEGTLGFLIADVSGKGIPGRCS